jgi:hypothetical protein
VWASIWRQRPGVRGVSFGIAFPRISRVGRENVSLSGAPGCSPAAPGRGIATSLGRPPAANQVTGTGAGRASQLRAAAATSTVRAPAADTPPSRVSDRELASSVCSTRCVPERRLTRWTGAAKDSCTGSPFATSTQRLVRRARGVRTARCTTKRLPRTQPTGALRAIVAVTTTF